MKYYHDTSTGEWIDRISPSPRISLGNHFTDSVLAKTENRLREHPSNSPMGGIFVRNLALLLLVVVINSTAIFWGLSGLRKAAQEPASSSISVSEIYFIDPTTCHFYPQLEK